MYPLVYLFCSFLLAPKNMEEAGVDGALIVQPLNHKFDHSLVTRSVQLALYFIFIEKYLIWILFISHMRINSAFYTSREPQERMDRTSNMLDKGAAYGL